MARIRTGDTVKIVSGDNKGTTGKVVRMLPKKQAALIENVGVSSRKVKPSTVNPRGGTKDIHVPVSLSKLALVTDAKSGATSRVGFNTNAKGEKTRVARQANNKEIK